MTQEYFLPIRITIHGDGNHAMALDEVCRRMIETMRASASEMQAVKNQDVYIEADWGAYERVIKDWTEEKECGLS